MTHPYFSPLNWQDNPIWEGETALWQPEQSDHILCVRFDYGKADG